MTNFIPSSDALSVKTLNNQSLIPKVEKHLDDVEKGKGYLSKGVAKEIRSQAFKAAGGLSEISPRLSNLYNGFSTGLTYSKQARFTLGVNQSVDTTRRLLDLYA